MPYIKNPNYDPNDRNSKRYIYQSVEQSSDPLLQPLKANQSIGKPASSPNQSREVVAPTAPPIPTTTKTSTRAGVIPALPVVNQSVGAPAYQSTPAPRTPAPASTPAAPATPAAPTYTPPTPAADQMVTVTKNGQSRQVRQDQVQGFLSAGYQQTGVPVGERPTSQPTGAPEELPPGGFTPTGDPDTDTALQKLAVQAGQAGLSVDKYLELVNKASAPTKAESDQIRNNLGIPDLIDQAFEQPKTTTVEKYRELYSLSGLNEVKDKIKKLDEDIAKKRADLVKATGDLYDNPWISQQTRSGRLGILNQLAQADIANSIAEKDQYLSLYDQGIGEIEAAIQRQVFDTGEERNLTVDKLNFLLSEAERDQQFVQRAAEQRGLRYLPDFLQNQPTGQEGFTLGEGQTRYDSAGNIIAYNPKSEQAGGQKIVKINGQDYVQNADGSFSLPQLPATAANQQATEQLVSKVDLIDNLLTSPGLRGSVGTYAISRWTPFTADKADRQEFASGVQQLINQETIDTLVNLKERGGTLGALSDQERVLLQTAATKLANWMQTDDSGNPTGKFEVSEKVFKDELNRIRDLTQKAITRATGLTPDQQEELRYTRQQYGISDDEARQLLGFSRESQTSSNGNLSPLAASIVAQESGGDYRAVGEVPKGYTEADKALGKYQIVPKYHFSKIGLPNTSAGRQQFLNSPALQDQLFSIIITDLEKQYNGDPRKVAAAYYGGATGASIVGTPAADKPQYAGGRAYPSINQYVNSVVGRLA